MLLNIYRKSFSESTEKSCESADITTERESLEFNIKQLILEINSKRKRDSTLICGRIIKLHKLLLYLTIF